MALKFTEKIGDTIDSYARVSIYDGFPFFFYNVSEAKLSDQEKALKAVLTGFVLGKFSPDEVKRRGGSSVSAEFLKEFREKIIKPVTYSNAIEHLIPTDDFNALRLTLEVLFKQHIPSIRKPSHLAEDILGESIGYGKLTPFISDESLEEIMVNGYDKKVFVFHKRYGHCKTNVDFSNKRDLDFLLQRIAHTIGKKFDEENPLLDARLPDGNRANATFPYVTPMGPSLTIRKFSTIPMSVVDLIANNTFTSELAAFLWLLVEGMGVEPMNLIITGGSGSGKTTTLNALSSFIRHPDRIVSIEDTLELKLGSRENWVQMESRPKMKGQEEVTMDDLLKNAMRMRPDRIIVGEVRGKEAETLFIAMDTGHKGCMGTLHSNSAKEMILRLKSEPMSVPEAIIPLLNLVVVQYRIYVKGKGIERRILSLTEVSSMEHQALLSNIYEWDRANDTIKRTGVPIKLVEIIAEKTLKSKKEIEREISVRKKILDWMLENNIRSQPEVEVVIQHYYYNPDALLEKVLSGHEEGN